MRNVRFLFSAKLRKGASEADPLEVEATSKIAAAGVEVLRRLDTPHAACDCLAALISGDLQVG